MDSVKLLNDRIDFNFRKNNEKINLNELRESILEIAKKKNINLKTLNSTFAQKSKSVYQRQVLLFALQELKNCIENDEFALYIPRAGIQLMLDGKYYLKNGDKGFIKAKQAFDGVKRTGSWGGMIYDIRCKGQFDFYSKFYDRHYLGRTHKSRIRRFIEHIEDSLDPYSLHTRKIELAIIEAIKDLIKSKPEKFGDNLLDFWEDYISIPYYAQRSLLLSLGYELLDNYFDIEILEVHKSYSTTPKHEGKLIKYYQHHVKGDLTMGTLYPNGLNMIVTSSSDNYIAIPMYDVGFMLSLGYKLFDIQKALKKHYGIKIALITISRRIMDYYKDKINAQKQLMRPVIQKFLESNPRISSQELGQLFAFKGRKFSSSQTFKNIFEGISLYRLQMIMKRSDFSWNRLKNIVADLKDENKILGYSKSQWIDWFIKDVPAYIIESYIGGEKIPNPEKSSSRFSLRIEKIPEFSLRKDDLRRKYRRLRTIDRLLESKSLEWIYVNDFGLMSREEYHGTIADYKAVLRVFYERLFEHDLTLDQLKSLSPSGLISLKTKYRKT